MSGRDWLSSHVSVGISGIELVSPPDNYLLLLFFSSPIPLRDPFALWFPTLAIGPINDTKPGCNVPVGQGSFFGSMWLL